MAPKEVRFLFGRLPARADTNGPADPERSWGDEQIPSPGGLPPGEAAADPTHGAELNGPIAALPAG